MFSPVASTDGYGDRDDIALARSRDQDQIRENQYKAWSSSPPTPEWGDINQQSIVELLVQMLRRGSASSRGYKDQVHWPSGVETISEAVCEACIIEGLDEDCYSPWLKVEGYEYEISLY